MVERVWSPFRAPSCPDDADWSESRPPFDRPASLSRETHSARGVVGLASPDEQNQPIKKDSPKTEQPQFQFDVKSGRWTPQTRFDRPSDFVPQEKKKRKPRVSAKVKEAKQLAAKEQEQKDARDRYAFRRSIRLARLLFWRTCLRHYRVKTREARCLLVYSRKGCLRLGKHPRWLDRSIVGRLRVYKTGQRSQPVYSKKTTLADRLSPTSADRQLLLAVEKILGQSLAPVVASRQQSRLTPAYVRSLTIASGLKRKTVLARLRRARVLVSLSRDKQTKEERSLAKWVASLT